MLLRLSLPNQKDAGKEKDNGAPISRKPSIGLGEQLGAGRSRQGVHTTTAMSASPPHRGGVQEEKKMDLEQSSMMMEHMSKGMGHVPVKCGQEDEQTSMAGSNQNCMVRSMLPPAVTEDDVGTVDVPSRGLPPMSDSMMLGGKKDIMASESSRAGQTTMDSGLPPSSLSSGVVPKRCSRLTSIVPSPSISAGYKKGDSIVGPALKDMGPKRLSRLSSILPSPSISAGRKNDNPSTSETMHTVGGGAIHCQKEQQQLQTSRGQLGRKATPAVGNLMMANRFTMPSAGALATPGSRDTPMTDESLSFEGGTTMTSEMPPLPKRATEIPSNEDTAQKDHPQDAKSSPQEMLKPNTLVAGQGAILSDTIMEEDEEDVDLERSDECLIKMPSRSGMQGGGAHDAGVVAAAFVPRVAAGNVRALPREIGFDDASSKASDFSSLGGTYQVESKELRDAFKIGGIYTGTVDRATSLPEGNGMMKYHEAGRTYEGSWSKGRWHGRGKIRNADGDIYVGDIVFDKKEGGGKMMFADGRMFVGKFQEDNPVEGTIMYPDKSRYVGQLSMDIRQGKGAYYFTDGSYFEGTFEKDKFHVGTMTWPDGGWYSGEFKNNQMHGMGKEIRPDGSIRHDGLWQAGSPVRH